MLNFATQFKSEPSYYQEQSDPNQSIQQAAHLIPDHTKMS